MPTPLPPGQTGLNYSVFSVSRSPKFIAFSFRSGTDASSDNNCDFAQLVPALRVDVLWCAALLHSVWKQCVSLIFSFLFFCIMQTIVLTAAISMALVSSGSIGYVAMGIRFAILLCSTLTFIWQCVPNAD